jgi:hypothetical protein
VPRACIHTYHHAYAVTPRPVVLELTTKLVVLADETNGCEPDAIRAVPALAGPIGHAPGVFETVPAGNVMVATVALVPGVPAMVTVKLPALWVEEAVVEQPLPPEPQLTPGAELTEWNVGAINTRSILVQP